ncbi:ENT domain containing protein [Musa troglodytarum]|uniref:ENT domain containing protein n=1 Tax=Musa troglodytarum TaxID=320322 RepID=A0A9E7FN29_9LILI|nr:ENT domain containing protein [Musa troglodytarum]
MEYDPSDSSGTDDDLPPSHYNRGARGGRVYGNGRATFGAIPYPNAPNDLEKSSQPKPPSPALHSQLAVSVQPSLSAAKRGAAAGTKGKKPKSYNPNSSSHMANPRTEIKDGEIQCLVGTSMELITTMTWLSMLEKALRMIQWLQAVTEADPI